MIIESLLAKIAAAVFKKAAIGGVIKFIAPAIKIYSVFDAVSDIADCVVTTNDCHELSVYGLEIISDPLTDFTVNQLISVGNTTFEVQRKASGLYLASSLAPRFSLDMKRFPVLEVTDFKILKAPKLRKPKFPNI